MNAAGDADVGAGAQSDPDNQDQDQDQAHSDTEEQAGGEQEEVREMAVGDDPDLLDLDLNHERIGRIENLDGLRRVETVCLRWNLIKRVENLDCLADTLTELDLYDNQIAELENLGSLVNLTSLDVSFNRIRKIQVNTPNSAPSTLLSVIHTHARVL